MPQVPRPQTPPDTSTAPARSKDKMTSLEEQIELVQAQNPGKEVDCYMTFPGHFDALAMHEAARGQGLNSRISTTPRAIQASCGVALLLVCSEVEALQRLAAERGLPFEDVIALPRQIDPHRDKYC